MCPMCGLDEDTQQHALRCHMLKEHLSLSDNLAAHQTSYNDIYGSPDKQLRITKVFMAILAVRERLLDPQEPADQGNVLDPPTG